MKSHPIQVVKALPLQVHRTLEDLLTAVRACRACEGHLPLGPRPVVQAGATARILVVGQAPGAKVHASGVPWDDKSGERLRDWMGIDVETFYDKSRIAILPMGYCYPGRAASGDLPGSTMNSCPCCGEALPSSLPAEAPPHQSTAQTAAASRLATSSAESLNGDESGCKVLTVGHSTRSIEAFLGSSATALRNWSTCARWRAHATTRSSTRMRCRSR